MTIFRKEADDRLTGCQRCFWTGKQEGAREKASTMKRSDTKDQRLSQGKPADEQIETGKAENGQR